MLWAVDWGAVGSWFLGVPLSIAAIFLGAYVVVRIGTRLIRRSTKRLIGFDLPPPQHWWRAGKHTPTSPDPRRAARAEAIASLLRSVLTVVVWTLAVLWSLDLAGVNLAPLLAGVSIVGIAVGFGAQSLVSDVIAGLFMLAEDEYGVGDVVDAGDAIGTVEAVNLRTTRIRGVDGTIWYVPNGKIMRIGNRSQGWARAIVDVLVGYGADIGRAQEIALATATDMSDDEEWATKVLSAPEVLGVERLGPEGVQLRIWVKTVAGSQWEVQRELRKRVQEALTAAGMPPPFVPPPPSA